MYMLLYTRTQHEGRDNQIELEGLKNMGCRYCCEGTYIYIIVFIEQFFILLMQCSMTTLELKKVT